MHLQNRVNPFGDIVAIPQRGTFTGNRGIIHESQTKNLMRRRWTNAAKPGRNYFSSMRAALGQNVAELVCLFCAH